jgi:hypothetical protein
LLRLPELRQHQRLLLTVMIRRPRGHYV